MHNCVCVSKADSVAGSCFELPRLRCVIPWVLPTSQLTTTFLHDKWLNLWLVLSCRSCRSTSLLKCFQHADFLGPTLQHGFPPKKVICLSSTLVSCSTSSETETDWQDWSLSDTPIGSPSTGKTRSSCSNSTSDNPGIASTSTALSKTRSSRTQLQLKRISDWNKLLKCVFFYINCISFATQWYQCRDISLSVAMTYIFIV